MIRLRGPAAGRSAVPDGSPKVPGQGWRTGVAVALGVTAAVVVVALCVQLGARLLVQHDGPLELAARLKAENDARTSLIQLIAGIGLVGGLYFTLNTFRLTRHTQRTDRYTKALDQIGSDSDAVRVGGIHALWLLANEDAHFWPASERVLAAFVRQHATPGTALRGDVQAALAVIGHRPRRDPEYRGSPVDLRGVDIGTADLAGLNLERVLFDGACLAHANLIDARLTRARLCGARLDYADLKSADLTYAKLIDASLREADMFQTVLRGADLTDCDITGAKNLDPGQLSASDGRRAVEAS